MQITELKHLTMSSRVSTDKGCLDEKHHAFVFLLKNKKSLFEIYYKNSDTPYKVKQVSGVNRRVTDDEFAMVGASCRVRLNQEVNKSLVCNPIYVKIANKVSNHLGFGDFEDFLGVAVKLCDSTTESEMHYHLSEMFLWDVEILDSNDLGTLIDIIIQDVLEAQAIKISSSL